MYKCITIYSDKNNKNKTTYFHKKNITGSSTIVSE